jgi:branched-subunit amino acid transport protein
VADIWWVVAGVALTAAWLKASGPVLFGRRTASARLARVLDLLPVAILSALVVSQALGRGRTVHLDTRVVAIAVAGLLVWRRAPLVAVVITSAAVAAIIRALGWDT